MPQPRIGCSGWNYAAWRGRFYPADLPHGEWLRYYASVFDTVEINNTFYRLPEASTFSAWRRQTPATFLMAVKASRFLTHLKRLREPKEPLRRLMSRARALGTRLGPILYQLPPTLALDLARLEQFAAALPPRQRTQRAQHVIEFRHVSWYVPETFQLLDRYGLSLCLHDKLGSAVARPFVGPIVYVRFHGTSGRYHGSYPARALDRWAARLAEPWQDRRPIYAYFNNDPDAAATRNALVLRDRLTRRIGAKAG
jgi:uncharacterized protein YecE (DUF72 family)